MDELNTPNECSNYRKTRIENILCGHPLAVKSYNLNLHRQGICEKCIDLLYYYSRFLVFSVFIVNTMNHTICSNTANKSLNSLLSMRCKYFLKTG